MFSLFEKYRSLIDRIEVIKFEAEDDQLRVHAKLRLKDDSQLIIRDYKFPGNNRKYSYHWMDSEGNLKIRWDNAAHWKNISTFPHHKHVAGNNDVKPSTETDLESVFICIHGYLG